MKVLDVISEAGWNPIGAGMRWLGKGAVIEEIAKGWVKEIKLYKREFGEVPSLDDLKNFAPADALTLEKAVARDPLIQEKAYKEAIKIYNKEVRTAGINLAKKGISLGMRKLGNGAVWLTAFVKWGARASLVWNCKSAWDNYNNQLNLALDDLGTGAMNGEQFKKFHDRILIEFYGEAAASIGASVLAIGLPKFIGLFSPIASNGFTVFFGNLIKTAVAYGTQEEVVKVLASNEGAAALAYWLTAEGVVDENNKVIEPPSEIGTFIEGQFAKRDWVKQKALDAANKRKLGDKIPPSVRPKTPAAPAAAAPASGGGSVAPSDEEEAPVSGRNGPAQAAQKASGTVIDWSELSKEGK